MKFLEYQSFLFELINFRGKKFNLKNVFKYSISEFNDVLKNAISKVGCYDVISTCGANGPCGRGCARMTIQIKLISMCLYSYIQDVSMKKFVLK